MSRKENKNKNKKLIENQQELTKQVIKGFYLVRNARG